MAANTVNPDVARDKRFYVYVYRDPRPRKALQPIYVGKGTARDARADRHWRRGADNAMLARILAKIRGCGLSPVIEIIAWFDNEADAFSLEGSLIAKFGRRDTGAGPLANMTDGGEGSSGGLVSEDRRAASGDRLRRLWADPAVRSKMLLALRETAKTSWADPETRVRRIAIVGPALLFGRTDPATRAKACSGMQVAKAAVAADPARSAKQSEQRSVLRREAWQDPETRAAYVTSIRSAKASKSAKMKALWDDPEYRAKHGAKVSAAAKAAWADPETRQRRTDAIRAARRRAKAAEADVSG